MRTVLFTIFATASVCVAADSVEKLRDRQDRAGLEKAAAALKVEAEASPNDANRWYHAAISYSYLAEVAYELRDKPASQRAAEEGVRDAEKAIAINGGVADYYRVLGTLCGQVIPANPIIGALSYGRKAKESLDRAIGMDPKSAKAHLAHGVGYYYLPTNMGGGPDNAIKDYKQAIALDPKNAEAYLWMGIAHAKQKRYPEAREALQKSLQLSPERVWAKQQLDKLPSQ
jgi:tetratricopeptide (TPR) repeat protein